MTNLALAREILRFEGGAALKDRLLDRWAARRRRRAYRTVEEVTADGLEGDVSAQPVTPVLNVLSTPPRPDFGGVQVQLLRRLEAEAELRPWALLYPEAEGYRLELRRGTRREAVCYRVPAALDARRFRDETFERVLRHATARVGARAVHFEQLVGLPLESVAELGSKLVVSVHDFGLFCLRPHLVERPHLAFCNYSRDRERCTRCLRHDWDVGDGFQDERRAWCRQVLERAAAVVYPSDFLRRTYAELVPGLVAERQHVVEPPSVVEPVRAPDLEIRRPIRHLAYIGSVKPHKGALVLEQVIRGLAGDSAPDLRWSVYGGGDREILARLRALPGVRVRGYYRAGEVPGMLRADRVDLALLLSIWPESYALTLDECRLAGVPVLAFDHGAIGDRLRRYSCGVAVRPAGPEAVLEALRELLVQGVGGQICGGVDFEPPDAGSAARRCLQIYRRLGLAGSSL